MTHMVLLAENNMFHMGKCISLLDIRARHRLIIGIHGIPIIEIEL